MADTESTRSWLLGCDMTPADRRKIWRFNALAFVWMAAFVAGSFVARRGEQPLLGWALAALTALLGIAVVAFYVRFLRSADELLRKIQLEALALAFGVGIIFMVTYRLCERLGAPSLDIADPMIVMVITWVVGQLIGARRYR